MVREKKEKKETREEFTGAKKEAPSPLWASCEKEKKAREWEKVRGSESKESWRTKGRVLWKWEERGMSVLTVDGR